MPLVRPLLSSCKNRTGDRELEIKERKKKKILYLESLPLHLLTTHIMMSRWGEKAAWLISDQELPSLE
jgi:hypothetical protein